ncbi:hypothetical protein PVIIG_05865 [Plasmodium vivax India VII]|uniref:PIR Superfamily Protein n=1 Tax=Plasmodium vivax India VII TaxID=1077284 RepID=A0A0J9S3W9_PLAVI|nr:hypothetical protein PVIIG_05865 [Plasmodium vivax India VII]
MDINEIQEKAYFYIHNLLSAYKKFDKVLEINDELYSFYDDKVTDVPEIKQKYKNISLKLLRNLRIFANNTYSVSQMYEYCPYLYHWLYINTKDYDDVNLLISIIFKDFQTNWSSININICPYDLYNKKEVILKSNDLVKLSYFKFNHESIKDILKKGEKPNYCLCQKYLEDLHQLQHFYMLEYEEAKEE